MWCYAPTSFPYSLWYRGDELSWMLCSTYQRASTLAHATWSWPSSSTLRKRSIGRSFRGRTQFHCYSRGCFARSWSIWVFLLSLKQLTQSQLHLRMHHLHLRLPLLDHRTSLYLIVFTYYISGDCFLFWCFIFWDWMYYLMISHIVLSQINI